MSRNLKRVGHLGIALTGVDAVANIQKACTVGDTATCNKAMYTETGKAAGSIVGGSVGGYAAYVGCNILFGVESAGTSLFWCAVIAGSASGYVGGYVGGKYGGKYGESKGKVLYEANGIK